jgi:hypothetical protein
MSSNTDYKVEHSATFNEPRIYREARVLREFGKFLTANEVEIDSGTATKLRKILNTRLLDIMDQARAES